jgi:hypothetical protein
MKLYHGTDLQGFLSIMENDYIRSKNFQLFNGNMEFVTYFAKTFEQAFLHGIYVFELEIDDLQFIHNFYDMNDETGEGDFATISSVYVSEKTQEEDELKVSKIYIPNIDYDLDDKIQECYPTSL